MEDRLEFVVGMGASSGRGRLSPRGSDRALASSLPKENLPVLEPIAPHLFDYV